MNVWETIAEAEASLPGKPAPEDELDPRWQAIIKVAHFIPEKPEAVWGFILRWGCHEDEDLRTAIATILLEHLLEQHFASFFPEVATEVEKNLLFADTFSRCWKFGQAKQDKNATMFDALQKKCRVRRQ